ncbi:Cytoplasmic dynein 1 intermediate chain 1 [Larimichthys crocea]|uniref:Uncharacterized protein n=1 Tax=Larimichthys crocea TaxID=215358 RepID=A0ACD3REX0_LARCR|nr:Cytoplasmic dynein 1 intermediate chain 1 [Larimichthys crocea]
MVLIAEWILCAAQYTNQLLPSNDIMLSHTAVDLRSIKAGICEMFEGHQGPVTGISCHSAVGTVDFSHLFITSSFDWTVKLWSTKHNKPLYSFEDNADYVYDVMWSPVHPAIFAAVDGMGRLDLWNLNNDT